MERKYLECPNAQRAFNEDGELVTLACDRWGCPYCQKVVAWRWSERVRFGIELWKPRTAYFWTLTLPAWVHYPKTGFRILPGLWANLRQSIRRDLGEWPYVAFVECHPHRALIPHFHIVSLRWEPRRLKDLAVHSGFGYEAKSFQITSKGAAIYVSKYCSKQGYAMPKNFRRVRASYDWPKLPDPGYGKRVLYRKPRESVKAYVRRVAIETGEDYNSLMSTWLS